MSSYIKMADAFAERVGLTLRQIGKPEFRKYFPDDKEPRWVFPMALHRHEVTYTFTFGQSLAAGRKKPTMYDVLSCMTKYDPGTRDEFLADYGYGRYPDIEGELPDLSTMSLDKLAKRLDLMMAEVNALYAGEIIYPNVRLEWAAMEELFPEQTIMEEFREIN